MTTLGHSRRKVIGESILSVAATPARKTAGHAPPEPVVNRVLAVSSSALLMHFARDLFFERILPTSGAMLPGLGGDSEIRWSRLVTLCCPSDCEPAALALSIDANECSCSVSYPTPTASDWKGGKVHQAKRDGFSPVFRDWWKATTGLLYPPISVIEAVQGFPDTWSE